MITIKEIYQWYNRPNTNPPVCPINLTPLQKIEWKEQNSQKIEDHKNYINLVTNSIKDRSFIGELLVDAPAYTHSIEKNKIIAASRYLKIDMNQSFFMKDEYREGRYDPFDQYEFGVKYVIICDDSFYNTIRLLHTGVMVELSGQIMDFSYVTKESGEFDFCSSDAIIIKLRLTKIKKIKIDLLYSNLLNDSHYFYNGPNSSKSKCFIATAAFGHQDKAEVVQLREFRDNVLRNSVAGSCFISTYNFLSPPIAFVIRQSNWLRKVTRRFLRKVVLPMAIRRTNNVEK